MQPKNHDARRVAGLVAAVPLALPKASAWRSNRRQAFVQLMARELERLQASGAITSAEAAAIRKAVSSTIRSAASPR
jgi:hypothetical protein